LFFEGLSNLYETGNLSRATYTNAYGVDFRTEMLQRKENEDLLKEMKLDPVAPSNKPGAGKPAGRPTSPPEAKGKKPKKE
jgi:hypothetical protein